MLFMSNISALVSFVGNKDPYPDRGEEAEEPGPLLALLVHKAREARAFDEAWVLCTGGGYTERARDLENELRSEGIETKIIAVDFPLRDVIDYTEIWTGLEKVLPDIQMRAGGPRSWSFLLDSGTPQAKGCLLLASRSGLFPATLIQGIPARFAGGAYKPREVRLEGFPDITMAPAARHAGSSMSSSGSPAFAEAERRALRVARYDDPVLILGQTGSGKTRIARIIHDASMRKNGPFIEVNCSAIPGDLAESELFGHVRGAFTGADRNRVGKFMAAQGGTLFLDEIGDLTLGIQAKILKAIDEGIVTPVGSNESQKADARIIAATNRDIPAQIRAGMFRQDLHERLKVVVIHLPSLAERVEDIRPLAAIFIEEWNERYGERRFLTDEALRALDAYSWPGNVRELINSLRSATCTASASAIGLDALPAEIRAAARDPSRKTGGAEGLRFGVAGSGEGESDPNTSLDMAIPESGLNLRARLLQVEWGYITSALRTTQGNREAAAKLLGLTGHALRKAMRERFASFGDEGGDWGP